MQRLGHVLGLICPDDAVKERRGAVNPGTLFTPPWRDSETQPGHGLTVAVLRNSGSWVRLAAEINWEINEILSGMTNPRHLVTASRRLLMENGIIQEVREALE